MKTDNRNKHKSMGDVRRHMGARSTLYLKGSHIKQAKKMSVERLEEEDLP